MKSKIFEELFSSPLRNGLTKPKKVRGEGYKMVNMGELFRYGRIENIEMDRVPLNDKEYQSSLLEYGDLLFARQSLVLEGAGKCSIFLEDEEEVCFESHIIRCRLDKETSNPLFFYYFFSGESGRSLMKTIVEQGAGAAGIRGKDLAQLEVPFITLEKQNYIANQLSHLDSLISLNSQVNQTLEQIAQAIFKSWFVDFEPTKAKIAAREALLAENPAATPEQIATAEQQAAIQSIAGAGDIIPTEQLQTIANLFPNHLADSELGEIPEGWEVGCLADLIEFNPKRTLKKGTESPYLDMKNVPVSGHLAEDVVLKEMKSGTKFINGDTLLARITPCLENGKTAYVDFLAEGQVGWGSTEFIVMRPKGKIHTSIAYLIARQETFRSIAIQTMTGTSGRQRADAKAIATKKWVIYPEVLLDKFSQITSPFMALSKVNGDQNKSLSLMRDSLLPKLLTGEISVQLEELES